MSGPTPDEPPDEPATVADVVAPEKSSRLKRTVAGVKAKAETTLDDLERRRATVPVIDIAFRGVEHDIRTGGGILAGAVAFRFFLFVVPYVFVVVFVFGFGADAAHQDATDLARRAGIVGLAASAIDASVDASTFARVVTFSIAVWALVSGARTLVKVQYAVHALIWEVPLVKPKRLTLQALAAIVIVTTLMVVIRLISATQNVSIVLWVVAMAFMVAVAGSVWLWLIARVFPSPAGTTWVDHLPGAVLFGIGVQVLHIVTVVWIARSIESKSETYGALGAALTILLWAYMLGRVVTAAASLNTVVWKGKLQRLAEAQPSSSP